MMKSLAFPNMFSSSSTKVVDDRDATLSNLKLALLSFKKELFGDPYFGSNLVKLLFSQNTEILADLIVDDIYTTIQVFLPQINIKRDDISISSDGINLFANIKATNSLTYTTDLYNISLTDNESE